MPEPAAGGLRVISVSSSSKKSGKSTVASFLVKELGADYGLKVSTGSHAPAPLVTDPEVISRPGTDTGALVKAGAGKVAWVNAPTSSLGRKVAEALELFEPPGLLVVEGNSALEYLEPDFAVFVMTVPVEDFKPSALAALARADFVLVDLRGPLAAESRDSIKRVVGTHAPGAKVVFYADNEDFAAALHNLSFGVRSKNLSP